MSKRTKEQLLEIADNPDLISGIHNYCDRWCERCAFTSKCAVAEMEKCDNLTPEERDINNQKSWDKLSEIFAVTFQMVYEHCKELGIDPNEEDPELEEQRKKEEKEADNDPCSKLAKKYCDIGREWFEKNETSLQAKIKELETILTMDLPGSDPISDAASLNDAIEIIHFYIFFIMVKIHRACLGRHDHAFDEEHGFPKDSDGSAKIALIAIDRSSASWAILMQNFPKLEDSILNILVTLEKLRKLVEKTFPDARNFIRPGFDQ